MNRLDDIELRVRVHVYRFQCTLCFCLFSMRCARSVQNVLENSLDVIWKIRQIDLHNENRRHVH